MKRIFIITVLLVCAGLPVLAQRRGAPAGPANPFQDNLQAIQQGQAIYDQNCTACHGPSGGAGEIGPAIVSGEHADARASDSQIFNTIKNGIPGTLMAAQGSRLADDDIWKIAAYIHALRGTAIDDPLPGDAAHGEQIFWGKGQCGSCHMIAGKGSLTGPDLSNIAGIRKSNTIIDALTKAEHHVYGDGGTHLPSLPPMDTYLPVRVTMDNGKVVEGVLMNQDGYSLQMMGNDQQLHSFDRAKLRTVVVGSKSLMPTDYDKRLTPDEFRDLLAFLTRQGTASAPESAAAPPQGVPQ